MITIKRWAGRFAITLFALLAVGGGTGAVAQTRAVQNDALGQRERILINKDWRSSSFGGKTKHPASSQSQQKPMVLRRHK